MEEKQTIGWDGGHEVDCLVLARDRVSRALLATCAENLGLGHRTAGGVGPCLQALDRGAHRFRVVMLGPSLEDGDPAEVAARLARHPGCGAVWGFGFRQPPRGIPGVELQAFPLDLGQLMTRLRAEMDRPRWLDRGDGETRRAA